MVSNRPSLQSPIDTELVNDGGRPLNRAERSLLAGWSLVLVAGFLMARGLEPDPRGYGTHEQFGLPACTFLETSGLPCPSCGMTTSFAYLARGRLVDAARANLAGCALAIVCAAQIPWAWFSILRGRLWLVRRLDAWFVWTVTGLTLVAAVHWIWRILAGASG